ncbi:MAG: N-acetylmuramoyl-L-alanine amidase [Candidatus Omnitrophica bacterium]|nr:N-acetylmuramoyl-L-alanine amidase [Candidatus Omnitrophota bacterium]
MRIIVRFALIALLLNVPAFGFCFSIRAPEKTLEVPVYRIRGTDYLPLALICDAYGLDWKWDATSMVADLNGRGAVLRLAVGERRVYSNGIISVQEKPVLMHKGAVCVPSDFLRAVFNKLFFQYAAQAAAKVPAAVETTQRPAPPVHRIRRIVLDAGHGGYDPGAIGRDGIKEKYIVLNITKRIREILEEQGIEVVMTRQDDRFVPLWRRVEIANRSGADLFISVHANASLTKRIQGFEVYYLSEAIDDDARAMSAAENRRVELDEDSVYGRTRALEAILWDLKLTEDRRASIILGNTILDNIDGKKREIRYARFFVLKGSRMPSILVEVGYISNSEECAKLGSGEYRAQIAGRIAGGILEYKEKFESEGGFTR